MTSTLRWPRKSSVRYDTDMHLYMHRVPKFARRRLHFGVVLTFLIFSQCYERKLHKLYMVRLFILHPSLMSAVTSICDVTNDVSGSLFLLE